MVENILDGIEVRLNTDYLENKKELDALANKIVYTGPIDAYFGFELGTLEYRSVRFENELLDMPNYQGNAAVNYTDRETLELLSINGLNSVRMRTEMICQRRLLVVSIHQNGKLGMSHIIR